MAGLKLNHITKIYEGDVISVKDFNLEVKDKEFLVLVGPSGCGKSTTLRMIAGLEEITKGDLYIGESHVNHVAPKDRDIAMVFQNYALYPHMNVYQNMAFGLKLRKFKKDEIENRIKNASKILDIEHLLERKPKALSGGQRQRVALGRAIVREPQVFLMDEPLSNLDAKLRVQMRAEIIKLQMRLETTTIYVTHDQTEAMTMGDRIVVMKDGEIQQVDTPDEIYNHPANLFVAGFIGAPSMNFLNGNLSEEGDEVTFTTKDFKVTIPIFHANTLKEKKYIGKEVVFGIRPENFYNADERLDNYNESVIHARLDLIENLGAEMFLYFSNLGETNIIARLDASNKYKENDTVRLALDMSKIHIFDKDTEETVI